VSFFYFQVTNIERSVLDSLEVENTSVCESSIRLPLCDFGCCC